MLPGRARAEYQSIRPQNTTFLYNQVLLCASRAARARGKRRTERSSLCVSFRLGRRDAQRGRTNSALGIWEQPSSLLIDTAVERTPSSLSLSVFVFLQVPLKMARPPLGRPMWWKVKRQSLHQIDESIEIRCWVRRRWMRSTRVQTSDLFLSQRDLFKKSGLFLIYIVISLWDRSVGKVRKVLNCIDIACVPVKVQCIRPLRSLYKKSAGNIYVAVAAGQEEKKN